MTGPVGGSVGGTTNGAGDGGARPGPDRRFEEEPDEPILTWHLPSGGTALRSLGLLRRPRWQLALLGVVLLSVVFVFLGRWQYHRHEAKVERRDAVRTNYDATPAPVEDLLTTEGLADGAAWHPVVATGSYVTAGTLLVRNRPLDSQAGFEVLVPLRLDDGSLLLVDRGWVPARDTAASAAEVPPPPSGTVRVVARVRPFEPSSGRTPPAGQLMRIEADGARTALTDLGLLEPGGPLEPGGLLGPGGLLAGYAVLASEEPSPSAAPVLLPPPDVSLGVNLAYAYQWWLFAFALYAILAVALYREASDQSGPDGGVGTGDGADGAGTGRTAQVRRDRADSPHGT